ncbi:MAG TPA: glycosyltransferase family 87 protein [Acidobacteriaceae bacterium]|nr:glycosyltransferase family 87 protein [Acidobacteriaceae bacterium]
MYLFVNAALALWALCDVVVILERTVLHLPDNFWHILYPWNPFSDFLAFRPQFLAFRTPQFWQQRTVLFPYPAPAALAFEAFFSAGKHALGYFLLSVIICVIGAALWCGIALSHRGLEFQSVILFVGIAAVSSYPFMFLFSRANIEIVNWIFVSLAIAALWCERWNLAGVLLCLAISFKLFPFILLGLFFSRRKYLSILIALGTALGVDIISLAILGPSIKIANQQIARGLQFVQVAYVRKFTPAEITFDHSLFAVVKQIAAAFHIVDPAHLSRFADRYMVVAALIGLLLYFTRIIRLPRINQIIILLTLSLLLPPVSGDYTLIHLYPAWMILALFALNAEPGIIRSRVLPACFFLLAIAFCPETYLFIGQAHIAGAFKALALSVLVILLLIYRFDEKRPDVADANAHPEPGHAQPVPLSGGPDCVRTV